MAMNQSPVESLIFMALLLKKRQSDVYRSIKTLDDELTKQLNNDGFNIHRGEAYLCLIPKLSHPWRVKPMLQLTTMQSRSSEHRMIPIPSMLT